MFRGVSLLHLGQPQGTLIVAFERGLSTADNNMTVWACSSLVITSVLDRHDTCSRSVPSTRLACEQPGSEEVVMKYLFFSWKRVFAVLMVALVGCSDVSGDSGGTGGSGGTAGTGGSTGTGGTAGTGGTESVTLFMGIAAWNPDGPSPALEGVMICEVDTDNCVSTDATGGAYIDLPANEEVAITLEKEGYAPWVVGNVTDATFKTADTWLMFSHDQLTPVAERLETAYPWTGGIVGLAAVPIDATGLTVEGATFELLDATGKPFYFDEETRLYSLGLDATSNVTGQFLLPLAEGGFAEVGPGVHQARLGGMASDCPVVSYGWPGDGPNEIRFPVLEGHITYASMFCNVP